MPKFASAPPTNAAGVASTPNTNCGEDVSKLYTKIGKIDPYRPYTTGNPATCAYPMAIGIDTSATIIPDRISFATLSFLNCFIHISPSVYHNTIVNDLYALFQSSYSIIYCILGT